MRALAARRLLLKHCRQPLRVSGLLSAYCRARAIEFEIIGIV